MPRVYGKAGHKVQSGVVSDQFGGAANITHDKSSGGSSAVYTRPNVKPILATDANGLETSNAYVVTSKNLSTRDLADIGNGSVVGLEKNEENQPIHSSMNIGVEVKKPTNNIYF